MHIANNCLELVAAFGAENIKSSTITIGNFDGMHQGHRQLIGKARQIAEKHNQNLILVSFEPHPLEVLAPHLAPSRLTDAETKICLVRQAKVQGMLILPFTSELAALSPEDFVKDILLQLNMQNMVTGYDFSLGRGRSGNAQTLAELGHKFNFGFERFGPVMQGGSPISSTRIRQLVKEGSMPEAARLLGRAYSLHGEVVHGQERGRILGFPTANLVPPAVQLPPLGVYATRVSLGVENFSAVTNIGNNPTFAGEKITIETHILDYSGDLYGQDIEVSFLKKLREQKKFASLEALIEAVNIDISQARGLSYDLDSGLYSSL